MPHFHAINLGIAFAIFIVFVLGNQFDRMARDIREIKSVLYRLDPHYEKHEQMLRDQVLPLIIEGKKIAAIKIVRKIRRCSLIEAKHWVDEVSTHL